jgi:hypothetical protein
MSKPVQPHGFHCLLILSNQQWSVEQQLILFLTLGSRVELYMRKEVCVVTLHKLHNLITMVGLV